MFLNLTSSEISWLQPGQCGVTGSELTEMCVNSEPFYIIHFECLWPWGPLVLPSASCPLISSAVTSGFSWLLPVGTTFLYTQPLLPS